MKKGVLLLMCGLPGAGKTTLAKKLEIKRKANRLCPDDWILQIVKNPRDVLERDRLRDPVEQLLWKRAQALLTLGTNIILENGFWSKEERNSYRDTAQRIGSKIELHFVDAPFEVLWQRVEKRNSIPTEFMMTKHEMENAYAVFEPPTQEEGLTYDYYQHYTRI